MNNDWLPHLNNSIPEFAYGDKIDMYVMALEGWRRGLSVKFVRDNIKNRIFFKLSDGKKEHTFSVTRGDKVTKEAVKICVNKELTKEYLAKENIPVPLGKIFDKNNTNDEIIRFAEDFGYPLVIKPFNGRRGKGVITNIRNAQEMKDALKYVRDELGNSKIIVEQFFTGEEYRVYVVDNVVVGVIKRIPANVIGDGKHSVKELIDQKNLERKKVPNLYQRLIKIDKEITDHLKSVGYNLNTILKKNEILFLREKGNLSTGGDSIDFTDSISEIVKKVSIDACKAIPGLTHGGVDVLYNANNNQAVVIEVNSRAGVGGHLFPIKGKSRDVPKAIIDFYFPETTKSQRSIFYFNLKEYWELIKSGKAKEVVLPNAPIGNVLQKKYVIKNITVKDDKFYNKFYKIAIYSDLNGYVTEIDKSKICIVISGRAENIYDFKIKLESYLNKRSNSFQLIEEDYQEPVMLGFEIRLNKQRKTGIKENDKIADYKETIKKLEHQNRLLKNKYNKIVNSRGYKYLNFIKKVKKRFS